MLRFSFSRSINRDILHRRSRQRKKTVLCSGHAFRFFNLCAEVRKSTEDPTVPKRVPPEPSTGLADSWSEVDASAKHTGKTGRRIVQASSRGSVRGIESGVAAKCKCGAVNNIGP